MPTKAKAVIKSHKCGAITGTGGKCKKKVNAGSVHCKAHTGRLHKGNEKGGITQGPAGYVNRKGGRKISGPRRSTGEFVAQKGNWYEKDFAHAHYTSSRPLHAHYKRDATAKEKAYRKRRAANKLARKQLKDKERKEKKSARDWKKKAAIITKRIAREDKALAKAAKVLANKEKPKKKRKRKKKPNLSIIV